MTPVTLALYENPLIKEQFIADLSAAVRGWKHRVTDLGGYDNASGDYWTGKGDQQTTANQAWDMFLHGLNRRIVASVNDVTVWEGRIQQLTLRTQGVALQRSLDTLANMVKLIYFQMGGDLVTNGGAEAAGTYGDESGPGYVGLQSTQNDYADISQSSVWRSGGTYSFRVGGPLEWGAGISFPLTAALTANGKYQIRFNLNIAVIGDPAEGVPAHRVQVTGANGVMFEWSTNDAGEHPVVAEFTASAVGTFTVDFRCNRGQVFYLDDLMLFENGTRRETQVYFDQDSIDASGPARMEFLKGAMDAAQANAEAQLLLAEYAWPRTECIGLATDEGLSIECAGFIQSLGVDYATTGGLDAASDHIAALVAQSTLLTIGIIKTNALNVYIEQAENILLWDALKQVIQAGDANGARWVGGCYAGRKFNYNPADTTPRYIRRNGQWCHLGGAPVDPALLHPGMVRWDDAPESPYAGRDPRIGYIASVEYDRDSDSVTVSEAAPERNRFGRKDSVSDALATATIVSARAAYAVVGTAATHQLTGSEHYETGLTAGHVLRASNATSFAFAAIQDGDLPLTIARDTEVAIVQSIADSQNASQSSSISVADSKAVSAAILDSVSKSTADSQNVSQSLNVSTADSKAESATAGGTDSIARSKADSAATLDSVSKSTADSQNASQSLNVSTADSKAGSAATLDSVSKSTADSQNASQSLNVSTADSKGASAATLDSVSKSTADSQNASQSLNVSAADSKAVSVSLNTSIADSKASSAGTDSIARSKADSAGTAASTADSKGASAATLDSVSKSTADSQNASQSLNVSVADSKGVSAATLDSVSKSTADSQNASQSLNVSVADSKGASAATLDSVSKSTADSQNTSQSLNISVADSKGTSAATLDSVSKSTADSQNASQSLNVSAADSKAVSVSLNTSIADSKASSAGTDSIARSKADSAGAAASTADSKGGSAATLDSVSKSTADSQNTSQSLNVSVADSKGTSAATLDSVSKSTADSKNTSQSANVSTADSKGASAATLDSVSKSTADSKNTSQSLNVSTADSKAVSAGAALAGDYVNPTIQLGMYETNNTPSQISADFNSGIAADCTIVQIVWTFQVGTTNNASNYWSVTIYRHDTDAALISWNTSSRSPDTWYRVVSTYNVALTTSMRAFYLKYEATGSPGQIRMFLPLIKTTA